MNDDDRTVYEVSFQGHSGAGSCEFSALPRAEWFADILKAQGFDCIVFCVTTSTYDME